MAMFKPIKTDPELLERIKESIKHVDKMTPEQKEAMYREQRKSWVRGNIGWD